MTRVATFWIAGIHYRVDPTTGCWLWLRGTTRHGYGVAVCGRRVRRASRVSWENTNGPIAAGLGVCHSCDTPACVNPAHLWLGTRVDNMQDAKRKGRLACGERHGESKLNARQVSVARKAYALGVSQQFLADCFGVGRCAVRKAVTRQTWNHLGD
jgi:hypothetical protein